MSDNGRRLAAIMFTDVVGFSRLMAEDEQGALALLRRMRTLIVPLIEASGGDLHKEIGDGTLSTFASAVDATRCALQIQRTLREQADFELRIGLHVGDVIVDGDDVHGDGVNIAARIEPLAPPGGLALSDAVLIQLRGRLDLPLQTLGRPMLKNIGLPIEIYTHVPAATGAGATDEDAVASAPQRAWSRLRRGRVPQWVAAYTALAFAVLQGVALFADLFHVSELVARFAAVLLTWGVPAAAIIAWYHGTPGRQGLDRREIALLLAVAAGAAISCGWQWLEWEEPVVQVAGKPATAVQAPPGSVVVLPFENPGGRPEDAYLSEGFADELRDQLSRVPGLRVVARGSSIAFRERASDIATIASELGVATVIEGSLRKAGERLRIAVRLTDAASGAQRWSQSYDRTTEDLMGVQQEVALAAAQAILPQISQADIPKPRWQASVNDLMLLARSYQQNAVRPQDQERVIELYKQVLEQDPESATTHARLGRALLLHGDDPSAAEQHLRHAIALDPKLAEAYANLGFLLWSQFRKGGQAMLLRALELNPNDADTLSLYGQIGPRRTRDHPRLEYSLRARELDPMSLLFNADVAANFARTGQVAHAVSEMQLIARRFPTAVGRQALGRIADMGGMLDEAIAWAHESLQMDPDSRATREDLAFYYARIGLPEQSRRIVPEPSLRVLRWEGRYAEVVERMQAQDLDEADADSMGYLAFALQALGRHAEALGILRDMGLPQIVLDEDMLRWAAIHHLATMIGSLQATGEFEEARRLAVWMDEAATSPMENESGWGARFWRACARSIHDTHEAAIAAFESSAAAPNLAWTPLLRDSACFQGLRDDPRYEAALRDLEARYAVLRAQLPVTLERHGLSAEPP